MRSNLNRANSFCINSEYGQRANQTKHTCSRHSACVHDKHINRSFENSRPHECDLPSHSQDGTYLPGVHGIDSTGIQLVEFSTRRIAMRLIGDAETSYTAGNAAAAHQVSRQMPRDCPKNKCRYKCSRSSAKPGQDDSPLHPLVSTFQPLAVLSTSRPSGLIENQREKHYIREYTR